MNNSALSNPAPAPKPRVGIVYRLYQPGGVQSVVLSLIKGLNDMGIIPDLIWDTPPSQEMLREKGVSAGFQPVHFPLPYALLDQAPVSVAYLLRTAILFTTRDLPQPYDFYYIFYNGFLVTDGTPHVRYLNGPPLVRKLETIRPGIAGLPFRFFELIYRSALRQKSPVYEFHRDSYYVINSDFTAQLFEEEHGVRLPVVHPPIDLSGRAFTADDLAGRDIVTFFSRFVDFKRPELFLKLAERYPNQRFVLMGGVKPQNRLYYESLRRKTQSQNLNNVTFIDNPTNAQVRDVLARTRFYVFPAVGEHFGMATVEAIGSGAIPYVHDSGGQREIVPDTQLRFMDSQFFEKFANLMALPDEELNRIRFQLRQHVEKFSEAAFIQKMLSYLNPEVLSSIAIPPTPSRQGWLEKNNIKGTLAPGKTWTDPNSNLASEKDRLKYTPKQ